ncbi:hypothetical protein [Mesomycoplasma ovipneumoniae]|nr:hypothetical protein [Mesomycoplasma ovipneumoniae]
MEKNSLFSEFKYAKIPVNPGFLTSSLNLYYFKIKTLQKKMLGLK